MFGASLTEGREVAWQHFQRPGDGPKAVQLEAKARTRVA
jgi:hypothetical protein